MSVKSIVTNGLPVAFGVLLATWLDRKFVSKIA